jgi:hypothetical protein
MDVEEFQWPTRLLSRRISPKPGLVERGAPCSVRDPVWDQRESFWRRRLRLGHAADASPANAHDGQMPAGVRTRSSASEESRYSPSRDQKHPTTARIHLNGAATHLLTKLRCARSRHLGRSCHTGGQSGDQFIRLREVIEERASRKSSNSRLRLIDPRCCDPSISFR